MLKTMALQITEDNYSVAAACLDAQFLLQPKSKVIGTILVINEIGVRNTDGWQDRNITFSNTTYDREEFDGIYELVDKRMTMRNQFAEVRHL